MKAQLRVGETAHTFEMVRQGDHVRVRVDNGDPALWRVVQQDGALVVLQHGAHVVRAALHRHGNQRQAWVDGQTFFYERVEAGRAAQSADHAALSATIPAIVTQLLVAVGDHVETGDKLILLESMKMVIPIQAPHPGTVSAIHCAPGDAIQPGVPLVSVDN